MVYAATTLSLAMLELLVRLPLGEVPTDLVRIRITVPDDLAVEEIAPAKLPGWNAADRIVSRHFGDTWLVEQRTCVLRVPAIAVPDERNVLFNPLHPSFGRVSANAPMAMVWDRRLFSRPAA
jgi:RES domain-containing protein